MSDEIKDIPEYTFEKKKKLAEKISNMKNKLYLKRIKDIIYEENPEISVRKSNRGVLMYFQNFTPLTYYKLDKFIIKLEMDKVKRQTKSITDTSDKLILSSEEPLTVDYSKTRTRLRYSNIEKKIIKRLEYEKIIKNNKQLILKNNQEGNINKMSGLPNKNIIKKKSNDPENNIFSKN